MEAWVIYMRFEVNYSLVIVGNDFIVTLRLYIEFMEHYHFNCILSLWIIKLLHFLEAYLHILYYNRKMLKCVLQKNAFVIQESNRDRIVLVKEERI